MKHNSPARVGVFGIGLAAYWPQFEGLKQRLEGYQGIVEKQLKALGATVISAGLVDNAPAAVEAGDAFQRADVDLVICYVGTYATSSQVLPAVQRLKRPVLVLNLQPSAQLDYENTDTGEWLANCCACCVPELSNAFARSRMDFNVVSGMLQNDARAWGIISDWVRAAGVCARDVAQPHRVSRPHLSGHARHVFGLHHDPCANRRPRRSARDR